MMCSRRQFLMIAGVFSAAAVDGAGAQSTAPGAPYADEAAADEGRSACGSNLD